MQSGRRLVREERFDLVHAHIYATAILGTGVPLVITEHTEALWQGRRERWASRRVYRRAEHIIAVSSAIRQRLIERDAVPPERITVIPNAVIPSQDAPPSTLPTGWRERSLVGVVVRLQPEKGVAEFLNAAARVSASFPEARFLVVGDGPSATSCWVSRNTSMSASASASPGTGRTRGRASGSWTCSLSPP